MTIVTMDSAYVDWRTQGRCAELTPKQYDTLFFPDSGRSINKAKAFCAGCPVKMKCLEMALATNEVGIWAGTTYRERLAMRKFQTRVVSMTRTTVVVAKPRKVTRKNFRFSA